MTQLGKLEKIPAEFEQYKVDSNVVEKTGILKITLEMDEEKNKTLVTQQYSKAPLLTQKALHYDVANPSMAYLFLMSSSGGVLQGDRYHVEISVKNRGIANITTQGATRIYKMDSNYATQFVDIDVDDNSYLEFLPDQIIPYKKSRYFQQVKITSGIDSTIVYSEVITPGRVAMGELFDYDLCYLRLAAKNKGGKTLFMDAARLDPKEQQFSQIGVLGTKSVFGTLYIITKKKQLEQISSDIGVILDNVETIGGCSFLPEDSGLVVRLVGNSTEDIKTIIHECVKIVRKHVLNSTFDQMRKT
ncbi:MAG: urease accessory protein UreD [Nitrososphaerota archaeon]|nr:urease accessory protein UreD [Nitrososphaerota archaeon]